MRSCWSQNVLAYPSSVDALARFTGDREHFRKTLEMLAKSVSASAAADALDG